MKKVLNDNRLLRQQQQTSSSSSNRSIEHDASTRKLESSSGVRVERTRRVQENDSLKTKSSVVERKASENVC